MYIKEYNNIWFKFKQNLKKSGAKNGLCSEMGTVFFVMTWQIFDPQPTQLDKNLQTFDQFACTLTITADRYGQ